MRVFDVWIEGWASNEGQSPATFMGRVEAENLVEACKKLKARMKRESASFWRIEENSAYFYGCKAFDNEKDARKLYG